MCVYSKNTFDQTMKIFHSKWIFLFYQHLSRASFIFRYDFIESFVGSRHAAGALKSTIQELD